jgi:hypothetical protein
MPRTPEDRLLNAIWGEPVVMYDRRAAPTRRASWRGGRRSTDWPTRGPGALERFRKRQDKALRARDVLM